MASRARLLRLARVQHDLALRVDLALHLVLFLLERIERLGACDQLRVLVGLRGGVAGGDPVAEGLARVGAGLLRGIELQLDLVEVARGLQLGRLRGLDRVAQRRGRGLVDEVLELAHALDLRQVVHDRTAQPDEKAREHQRHEPEAAAEPFFGKAQGFAHFISSLFVIAA
jgi:hypothetical protein